MRRNYLSFGISLISILLFFSLADAETIYCKDGVVLHGKISHRSGGSVWIDSEGGYSGVALARIERIENEDGSISQYDLAGLSREALKYLREGNYAEAINLYNLLLASLPQSESIYTADIYYIRGILYHQLGKLTEAAKDYNFLVRRAAADARVFNNLGIIYAEGKAYPEAEEYLLKALNDDPQMTEARNNLARLFLMQNDLKRAIDQYQGIIEAEPQNAEALYNLGVIYMQEENYSSAEGMWKTLLGLEPDNKEAAEALEVVRSRLKPGN